MTLECSVPYCLATHYALTPVIASQLRASAIDAGWVAIGPTEWELDWFCPTDARFATTWLPRLGTTPTQEGTFSP